MNDRQRKMFMSVVEAGSFSKAAQQAYVTPQSVSQQMRHLEAELGITLLERGPQGVAPTEAGRAFYEGCRALERAEEDLVAACREIAAPAHHVIRLGQCSTHSLAFFVRFIPEFLRRCPANDVEYVDVHHADMLNELRQDLYDVTEGIRPRASDRDGIGFTCLRSAKRCCLVSAKSPLVRNAVITPEDLRGQLVYTFSLEWAHELQDYLQARCPDVQLLEAPSASHCPPQRLCEAGNAVYLAPDHMRDRFEPLVPVPFDVPLTMDYGLVYLASKADWLADLLACAVEVFEAREEVGA